MKEAEVPDVGRDYERYQGWPAGVAEELARHGLSLLQGPSPRCLILGTGTGINDTLPLARLAGPEVRIVAGDIDASCLARLRDHAGSERLANIEVRRLDINEDLSSLGTFDLVTLLFVIHRLQSWEGVVDRLVRLVAPGGSFFISEFAGPSGLIYLSNEAGGRLQDPVSRLIRRYFELLPERFAPPLKSTFTGPVRARLGRSLDALGQRDFIWRQSITPGEMLRRIEDRAYAPYFSTFPPPGLLARLRAEFAAESGERVELEETIRIFRFGRPPFASRLTPIAFTSAGR